MPTLNTLDNAAVNSNFTNLNGGGPVTAMGNQTGSITVTALSGLVTMTATGNLTVATTATGATTGDILTLKITQDGTGSRTFTKGTNTKLAGGAVTLTTTAAAVDLLTFRFDGTSWNEIARSLALA